MNIKQNIRLMAMISILSCTQMLIDINSSAQTIDECYQWAEANYPAVSRYHLIEQTRDYTLAAANNGWLPQITLSGQASYQSDVTSFPDQLNTVYQSMGLDFEGVHRDQYKVVLDVNQTIWDGGVNKARKDIAKADADVQSQSLDVQLYALRETINNLFFGVLLIDHQLELNDELQSLLKSNIFRVQSLVDEGVADKSDVMTLQAELLKAAQDRTSIEASRSAYSTMLATFTGHTIDTLVEPSQTVVLNGKRPEFNMYDARIKSLDAQTNAMNSALYPKFSFFVQGLYSNPGLNLFDDMMHSHFSWNYILGARFQWNISSFYNRKTDRRKIDVARNMIENDRAIFQFNNDMKSNEHNIAIAGKKEAAAHDEEIISLRRSVRETTEVKVCNGVASSNDLVRDIVSENQARISAAMHRIDLLKTMYDNKVNVSGK